jgi:hypothetical protein
LFDSSWSGIEILGAHRLESANGIARDAIPFVGQRPFATGLPVLKRARKHSANPHFSGIHLRPNLGAFLVSDG